MSTSANIIVTDGYDELVFYRHWDGEPDTVLPLLNTFVGMASSGMIRDNVFQAAGWLIIMGRQELLSTSGVGAGWKVGTIEPTNRIHDDISYLYVVDLESKTVSIDVPLRAERTF